MKNSEKIALKYLVAGFGIMIITVIIAKNISTPYNKDTIKTITTLAYIGAFCCFSIGIWKSIRELVKEKGKTKKRKRIESIKVDEIMQDYKDSSIPEKIKFLENIPYGSYEVAIDCNREDIMHEIELFMEKHDLNLDEYMELEDRLWEYHKESEEDKDFSVS